MNDDIIYELQLLTVLREIQGNKYKILANRKAIDAIERINWKIKSGNHARENIPGIGEGIKNHIDEILSGNGIQELNNLSDEEFKKVKFISELEKIHGIGFKKAEKLYYEGKTIKDYENTKIQERIPRNVVKNWIDVFDQYVDDKLEYKFTGSYRRKQESLGDIDILIYIPKKHKNIKERFLQRFINDGIIEQISSGDNKFEGYLYIDDHYNHVKIDMMFIYDYDEYPYALLYFTGNKTLNTKMRSKAKNMGYHLTNTEMTDDKGNRIYVDNEQEIFEILNMEYLPPTERNL